MRKQSVSNLYAGGDARAPSIGDKEQCYINKNSPRPIERRGERGHNTRPLKTIKWL